MLRIVRGAFFAVLISVLVTGMLAFAAGASAPSKTPVTRPAVKPRVSMSAKVPRTPYERIFAPGLARSLKTASGGSERESARPAARSAAALSPT